MNFHVAAGTVIDGRYHVISRVGSGGMADVYCAEDTQLGRRVAVKLLHERFAQDEEFVERFRREASSAAGLSHANIVSVYDRGEWGDTYYIAMEYLDGRSLDSIVREEAPLAPERAIEITEQVLRAARFAHSRGVVHRDLKPHNVIIDGEGRVKVTDFGIARAGASEITQTGSIMGTARYLSPEQAQGQAVSPRSDLYAVGIMLYELLTGTVPFEGDSVVAIALRHLSEPPRPPSSLVPTISPSLDAIVMRALAKGPAQRFADADEFLAALEDERERSRQQGGSRTAALAPVVVVPPPYQNPATYTTQAIGPLGPMTGSYGMGPTYWDPHTTGIIPPGAIMLPPGGRRGPVWPWALLGAFVAAAVIAALVFVLVNNHSPAAAVRVPNVVGQSKVDAQANLQAAGFVPISVTVNSSRAAGTVVKQIPHGGQQAKSGANVVLHISGGRPVPSTLQVPNVVGANGAAATAQLHSQGFKVSTARTASTTVAKNTVISTIPAGGSTAPRGSTVVLTVSSGPPRVGVPNVVGETADQARLLLQARLFVVATTKQPSSQPPGTVLKQTPASGKAPQGSTVTLTVAEPLPNVTVPYLIGLTEAEAGVRLGKLGLTPAPVTVIRQKNPAFDNLVLHQQPRGGKSVPPGTVVTIRIEHYVAPVNTTTTNTSTTASTTTSTTPGPTPTGASGPTSTTGPG
jgi:beta-lactam-binding protein with PASTA domain/predicted Ser/Thr protein kinase